MKSKKSSNDSTAFGPRKIWRGLRNSSIQFWRTAFGPRKIWRGLRNSSIQFWRVLFFLLMAHNYYISSPPPISADINPWEESMAYYHFPMGVELAPKNMNEAYLLKYFGTGLAVLATYSNVALLAFTGLSIHKICITITSFVNHDYLFILISFLATMHAFSDRHGKQGWLNAMRGQIVVVYFFAALWKLHPDWLSGEIVKSIFLSFEEQNAARNIPWRSLYEVFPSIFLLIAFGGFLLDLLLFFVLMFLPPGHKFQSLSLLFHGFTGFTMSQRIGYAFPGAMILAGLIFEPCEEEQKQPVSHAKWLRSQLSRNTKGKKYPLAVMWLFLQYLIPLRMPIVSNMSFKHTMEGYRWSWTMMLHAKSNTIVPGVDFLAMRPKCNGQFFPNPLAEQFPKMDPQSFEFRQFLSFRAHSVCELFPQQASMIANKMATMIGKMCSTQMSITQTHFASTNNGPFYRIIDPNIDLLATHNALNARTSLEAVVGSFLDKRPKGHEYILPRIGRMDHLKSLMEVTPDGKWNLIVDRSPCMFVDPIRMFDTGLTLDVIQTPITLFLHACEGIEIGPKSCTSLKLRQGQKISIGVKRTILIGNMVHASKEKCSEGNEDIVLRFLVFPNK